MFQRNLWNGSQIEERKKTVISNAERIVLRNMYPPGCRVELEDMEADPYVKLSPGDLGTVQFVDDAGQIHVSWDCGHSLAMVFGVDHCKCVMREERLQEILQRIQAMPFESLEKMERYVMEKLSGVFPKISFQTLEYTAFAVTPSNIPSFPERLLISFCGASIAILMIFTPRSLCGIPILPMI